MTEDNLSNKLPCQSYVWLGFRGKKVPLGYKAVGPGWHSILKDLDQQFVRIMGDERDNYKKIVILQIKEKFGRLVVYADLSRLTEEQRKQINHEIAMAEIYSLQTCEKCGSHEGVETRSKKDTPFARTLTLCAEHHLERDNLPIEKRFFIGNEEITL